MVRPVLYEPGRGETGDEGEQALDDEDPRPAGFAADAIHFGETVAEDTAATESARPDQGGGRDSPECAGHDGAAEEDRDTLGGFLSLVPSRQEERNTCIEGIHQSRIPHRDEELTREETAFKESQQEPQGEQLTVRLDEAHADLNDSPEDDDRRNPSTRSEFFEDEVGGDLKEHIAHEEDRRGDIELVVGHVKVFRESCKFCCPDICAIQERKSEKNAMRRNMLQYRLLRLLHCGSRHPGH